MAEESSEDFELRLVGPGDKVTGLSLGHEDFTPLKTFVQKHSKAYAEQMLATTYGVFSPTKLVGYVTLVCGEVASENPNTLGGTGDAEYKYKHFPAVKIARLAVDRRYRGTGMGRHLVEFSLGVAKQVVAATVGCRFVVLDAKKQSVAFYERCGFRLIDTDENRARSEPVMFIDLRNTE